MIANWFKEHGIYLNTDAFALSTLLQWLWRSAIRDGKPITVYIPSSRMRGLLKQFLDTGEISSKTPHDTAA
ncbi:hypothetical protein SDC9_133411 [bioreactor metagenome]|uniref:Uncharacterized protein n=1 Tax=bioreactor metagenome TaxID=1076179 RepID=A0A645DCM0_9ZZZZ